MNMAVRAPTETEMAALKQRRSFQDKIAIRAAALAASKLPSAALNPETMPAETDPPRGYRPWFTIEGVSAPREISIREIQEVVCEYYGVSVIDIVSARRDAVIVRPRQVAVYLCRKLTRFSLPVIGQKFGGRDHTTQISSVRKITRMIETDANLRATVDALTERLEGENA